MKTAWMAAALCLALTARTAAAGTIAIDIVDGTLGEAVTLLAAQSGRNIVADTDVAGERVTLHLKGVTLGQALHAIAASERLVLHNGDGITRISARPGKTDDRTAVILLHHANAGAIAKEIAAAVPAARSVVADARTDAILIAGDDATIATASRLIAALDVTLRRSNAVKTVTYRLRYVKPDDMVAKLKALLGAGTFLADEDLDAVLVTGSDLAQARARNVVRAVDVASAQVLFEVKVADVTPQDDSSNVGLEFGGMDLTGVPIPGSTAYAFTGGSIPVNVRLNAMISQGRASILATPKLVTLNNKPAELSIGETYPIVFSTSVFGGQNVQFVDVGVHLKVTPTIGSDGSVTAELHPDYSELIGYTSTGYPIVASRKIDSTLRVRDDQTIVFGGLMRDVSSETIEKIPWLSQIPILGKFFENKATTHQRDEIVFLITPHVIYPVARPAPEATHRP